MQKHFIQDRLKQTGKTQEDLSAVLGRDRSAVSRIVNEKQDVTLRQLEPTAELLDLSVADLLTGLGINPGLPAVDPVLMADCLVPVLARYGIKGEVADDIARMAATLYTHSASDARFRDPASLASSAALMADFVRTQRK